MNLFKLFFIFIFISLSACTSNKDIGSSKSDLLNKYGIPKSEKKSVNDSQYLEFKNDKAFEVKNNKVISSFRNANSNESNLKFWLSKWGNESKITTLVITEPKTHIKKIQYTNSEQNIAIVFNVNSRKVERVIQYLGEQ